MARGRSGQTPRRSFWRARPTRASRSSTSRASPRSPTRPARRSPSTTSSPRRSSKGRSRSGADCVVYSATKHIDGQGRCLGGVILARAAFIETKVQQFLRMTGPTLSPFNAWVLLKGLETLPLRVERQTATAGVLADALHAHPKLAAPHLSGPPRPPAGRADRPPDDRRLDMIALDVKAARRARSAS